MGIKHEKLFFFQPKRSQLKRTSSEYPWFVRNNDRNPQMPTERKEITRFSERYLIRFERHPNVEIISLLGNSERVEY